MASISLIFAGQFVDVAIPTEFFANDLVCSPPSEHRALYLNAWNRLSLSSIVAPKDFVVSTCFTQVPFVVLSLWPDPQIQKVLVKTQRHTPLSTAHGAFVPEPIGQDNASNKGNPTGKITTVKRRAQEIQTKNVRERQQRSLRHDRFGIP